MDLSEDSYAHFPRQARYVAKGSLRNEYPEPIMTRSGYEDGFQVGDATFLASGPIADSLMPPIAPTGIVERAKRPKGVVKQADGDAVTAS